MKTTNVNKLFLMPALILAAVMAIGGCGGGGGKGGAANTPKVADATIAGTVKITGETNCSGVVVVAERVSNGVTRTVDRMLAGAKAGRVVEGRAGADTPGVYMTTSGADCSFKLLVVQDTYSVSAYKENSTGAQPQTVAARSAAIVTVNFELVATGSVSGTATLGNPGSDLVVVFLDGTSFAAFAKSDGTYTISNIPVGTYTIKFSRRGVIYASNPGVVITAGVTTNDSLTSVDFTCVVDSDCDDNSSGTQDTCDAPATTGSSCSYINVQTVAGGTIISADATWDGIVNVTGQIKVDVGVTLTINPGTEIRFAYPGVGGDLFNSCCRTQTALGGIRVDGTISAVGTVDDPITFTLAPDDVANGAGYWGGIYIYYGVGTFEYVNMNYPSYAIQSDYSSLTISHVAIANAGRPAGDTYSSSYSYHISVKTAAGWKEVGVRHYGLQYENQQLDLSGYLPDADGEYKVRIEQAGMYAAQIESIEMMMDGRPVAPVSARNASTKEDVTYKIVRADNDVVDAHLKTFEVMFDARGAKPSRTELSMKAREEDGEVTMNGIPFLFPANSHNDNVATAAHYDYKLGSSQGAPALDGMISANDRLPAPAFAQRVTPMSGHPEGVVYGYVKNDRSNLYVTVDFTPDNTYDGTSDFAAVYVKVGNEYKKFRVSVPETKYGSVGFNYTGNVSYQHKVYEFAIPLSEIGNPSSGQQIAYIVEAYGTSSLFGAVVTAYYNNFTSISDISISFAPTVTGNYYGMYLYNIASGGLARKAPKRRASAMAGVTLSDISITGSPDTGLRIYEYGGDLAIDGLAITGTKSGNGLYFYGGNSGYGFTCDNCVVSDTKNGDNFYVESLASVTLSNCEFNYSSNRGIYMYNVTSASTITNCDFSFNGGAGLAEYYATMDISNSRFEGNCDQGIYAYANGGEVVNLNSSNVINNKTYGIVNPGAAATYMDSVFLSGNNNAGANVLDTTTDLSSSQKYNAAAVVTPAESLITGAGMPTVSGDANCPVNSY